MSEHEDLNTRLSPSQLRDFIQESNRIEGIFGNPSPAEVRAHRKILAHGCSAVKLDAFVDKIAPGHQIRSRVGFDVRVGDHIAPRGGPDIPGRLNDILLHTLSGKPFDVHRRFLHLHPFTDGNGRASRVTWLYMMLLQGRPIRNNFLHEWYYQSLQHFDQTEGARNGLAR